jgi:hypothetical protein
MFGQSENVYEKPPGRFRTEEGQIDGQGRCASQEVIGVRMR